MVKKKRTRKADVATIPKEAVVNEDTNTTLITEVDEDGKITSDTFITDEVTEEDLTNVINGMADTLTSGEALNPNFVEDEDCNKDASEDIDYDAIDTCKPVSIGSEGETENTIVIAEMNKDGEIVGEVSPMRELIKEDLVKHKEAVERHSGHTKEPVVKIHALNKDAIIPEYQTDGAAAFDLCITETVDVQPDTTVYKLKTGLSFAIPKGYFGLVAVRSSVGFKRNCILPNGVGVIDSDYRGEVMIALVNQGSKVQRFNKGERVAQMIILPCPKFDIEVSDTTLDETERGDGGFGSTGKN